MNLASASSPSAPLRVCHLITDLNTGGAERSLINLITRMERGRFDNEVVSLLEPGPMAVPLVEAGISVTSLGMRRGRAQLSSVFSLARHLRSTRPAILQTWLYHADLIGTLAAAIARPERLLWNVRCTDMTQADDSRRIRQVVRALAFLSGRPDAIIVNSQRGYSDHVALGYHPKRWVNIANGVDLDRFYPRYDQQATLQTRIGLRANVLTIGLVARFHPMKDVKTFLHAASLFARSHLDAQFVLCGEGLAGDNGVLAEMIGNGGLADRIFLLGRRSDIDLIYPAFDIFSLSSIYGEGFPNVLCEAMACGVPCVATDVGDSAEIVGECGIVVSARDPAALAAGWEALRDRDLKSVGKMARARVAAHFGLDRMCAQYQSLYQSLSVSGRQPA